jgi:hydrogenase maturation protease
MVRCSTKYAVPDTLLIGYGNSLRGDDGVGLVVAQRLQGLAVHQLTPDLAEPISQAAKVIFIDADVRLPPGEVRRAPVVETQSSLGHHCTPGELLVIARTLYGHAPPAELISIGIESTEFRESLSAPVLTAAEQVVATLRPCP